MAALELRIPLEDIKLRVRCTVLAGGGTAIVWIGSALHALARRAWLCVERHFFWFANDLLSPSILKRGRGRVRGSIVVRDGREYALDTGKSDVPHPHQEGKECWKHTSYI